MENNKDFGNENKNKNSNSSISPHIILFTKLKISHEKEMFLNPDKNEKNYEEHLNSINKEDKNCSACKFEIKNRISLFVR